MRKPLVAQCIFFSVFLIQSVQIGGQLPTYDTQEVELASRYHIFRENGKEIEPLLVHLIEL